MALLERVQKVIFEDKIDFKKGLFEFKIALEVF